MSTPLVFCELCQDELTVSTWYGVWLCAACTTFANRQVAQGDCGCIDCLRLAKRMEELS
jgi:hypothetical protein